MKATTIMIAAFIALVLGRWAHNQPAIPSPRAIVEIVFAVVAIAFLDQGKVEPIAKGFAFLFLAAVLLGNNSILTSLAKVSSKPITYAAPPKKKA